MEWRGRRGSRNVEDRRGMRGGAVGGMGIVGVLAVLAFGYFFGIDISPVVQGIDQGSPGETRELTAEEQAQGEMMSVVLADTEEVWHQVFREEVGQAYQEPKLVLFSGMTPTACGTGQAAMGPFYCPGDRSLYLDTQFFKHMAQKMNAGGDFAAAYVVAHEVGHHVQNLLGILPQVNKARSQSSERSSNRISVATELQADCFAGMWARRASDRFGTISRQDINDAINAAAAVGDDTLQKAAGRAPVPDSFTHGSSAERQEWFVRGFEGATLEQCNTFKALGI
ncbi:MAG: neutral zinc metallopeptidase [Paracoccus sp. (in: a-proteobacteria)]|nr:neutral zinc metallopeptidase [Paracoccus sp. (in: a-proteobacteria)]